MSHHHNDHDLTPHIQHHPKPTIQERLWGTQARLHDIARDLARPGPHGARYVSDIYDILGTLTVATADLADIIQRATRLLTDASDCQLLTRPCSGHDRVWLEASEIYARLLVRRLEKAQTAINDIGGHLTRHSPPPSPPRN